MKRAGAIVVLWLALAGFSRYLAPTYQAYQPQRTVVRFEDLLLDMLGEGRTMLARLLWFKMDLIHEQLDDQGVEDFKQDEVVPLLRMVTFLDPSFTEAYDTLAYELYRGHDQLDEAIELVEEGIQFNPKSYQLHFRRAFLAQRKKDWLAAMSSAQAALPLASEPMERLSCLRIVYRCAVAYNDAELGNQVIETMRAEFGIPPSYEAQANRWRVQLGLPPRQSGL